MFYGYDIGNAAKERHAEMLREAEQERLARRGRAQQTNRTKWSSALLISVGKQLIGWGQQLERAA